VSNILDVCLYSCLSHTARNVHGPYYIVICGLFGSTVFFHFISQTVRSPEKFIEYKNVFLEILGSCDRASLTHSLPAI